MRKLIADIVIKQETNIVQTLPLNQYLQWEFFIQITLFTVYATIKFIIWYEENLAVYLRYIQKNYSHKLILLVFVFTVIKNI